MFSFCWRVNFHWFKLYRWLRPNSPVDDHTPGPRLRSPHDRRHTDISTMPPTHPTTEPPNIAVRLNKRKDYLRLNRHYRKYFIDSNGFRKTKNLIKIHSIVWNRVKRCANTGQIKLRIKITIKRSLERKSQFNTFSLATGNR